MCCCMGRAHQLEDCGPDVDPVKVFQRAELSNKPSSITDKQEKLIIV